MALIVEDGTGLADAQSYISVVDADTYHSERGNADWAAADAAAKEASLIKATEYLDGKYGNRWLGWRRSSTQALDWPRDDVLDELGTEYTGVPRKLAQATTVVALKVIQGADVSPDLDRGGKVHSESVGKITTVFQTGAPAQTLYTAVSRLLTGLVRSAGPGVRITR